MSKQRVKLGQVVCTCGVNDWMHTSPFIMAQINECLNRHASGDWGEVPPEDAQANDRAVIVGERLLSAYTVDGTKVWIITEWDRSVTTVLFPDEY